MSQENVSPECNVAFHPNFSPQCTKSGVDVEVIWQLVTRLYAGPHKLQVSIFTHEQQFSQELTLPFSSSSVVLRELSPPTEASLLLDAFRKSPSGS